MALEEMPVGAIPPEAGDEQRSPADVAASIRKDLAKFQRTSTSQALRKKAREELRAACKEALHQASAGGSNYPDIRPIVAYLIDQGRLQPAPRRSKTANGTASRSN